MMKAYHRSPPPPPPPPPASLSAENEAWFWVLPPENMRTVLNTRAFALSNPPRLIPPPPRGPPPANYIPRVRGSNFQGYRLPEEKKCGIARKSGDSALNIS
eukprot:1347760-Amorphochlora_amoeboformis.AAC.1